MENGSLSAIIKPNRFGAFPESLVAVYIGQARLPLMTPRCPLCAPASRFPLSLPLRLRV